MSAAQQAPVVPLRARAQAVPALSNPWTGQTVWYHGTSAHPDELDEGFTHPAAVSPEACQAPEEQPSGTWNALLGIHFAADRGVAVRFASGEHSSSASDRTGDAYPSIVAAQLAIASPKVYPSEYDLDSEVYEHEWADGNHISAQLDGDGFDDETWPIADHLGRRYGDGLIPPGVCTAAPRGLGIMSVSPDRTEWLNGHQDRYGIAERYRERLEAEGYDGVVYGNEFERSDHGRPADVTAVAFSPDQITIGEHRPLTRADMDADESRELEAG